MPRGVTQRSGEFIDGSDSRKGSAKRAWRSRANWASGSGFCYATRSITRRSAVGLQNAQRKGEACLRECLCGEMVRWWVTGKMKRRPASR